MLKRERLNAVLFVVAFRLVKSGAWQQEWKKSCFTCGVFGDIPACLLSCCAPATLVLRQLAVRLSYCSFTTCVVLLCCCWCCCEVQCSSHGRDHAYGARCCRVVVRLLSFVQLSCCRFVRLQATRICDWWDRLGFCPGCLGTCIPCQSRCSGCLRLWFKAHQPCCLHKVVRVLAYFTTFCSVQFSLVSRLGV